MTIEPHDNPQADSPQTNQPNTPPALTPDSTGGRTTATLPLPGMVAIALYMLVLAATVAFGVISGHIPRLLAILSPVFIVASFGLLRLYRWAWALTLSAVFLLMTYNLWSFFEQKEPAGAIQGGLNLVFFFYLVRVDVRSRLR